MADARRMGKSELFSHFAERFEVKRTQAREFFDELTTLAEKELKRSGEFVLHVPLALALARAAIAFLDEAGHPPNCYVRDQLFVAEQTAYSRAYAEFQHIPVGEVGDLLAWIDVPPTKLVAGGEPDIVVLAVGERACNQKERLVASPATLSLEAARIAREARREI